MKRYGHHATTESRAEIIKKQGFKPGIGRAGEGVYFWYKNKYSEILAECWYYNQLAEGSYKNDSNRTYYLLSGEFESKDEEFLNLEDDELKVALTDLAEEKGIDPAKDFKKLPGIYGLLYDEIEKIRGTKLLIIMVRVAIPKPCTKYPISAMGAPLCYIIRDSRLINLV